MIKNNKKMFFLASFLIPSLPIFTLSCINNRSLNNNLNSVMSKLDKLVEEKRDILNNDSIDLITTVTDNTGQSLFRILLDQPNLISTYFSFSKTGDFQITGYDVSFSFFYETKDSYGNNLKPFVSETKNSITIPVLISFMEKSTGIRITKYVNLFTLDIVDGIVSDSEDQGYNGSNGKRISFSNFATTTNFKAIPKEMVNKYLDFILLLGNDDYKKPPKYESDSSKLSEWKGKTLTEVRSISQAISAPTKYIFNGNTFNYSIKSSSFYDKERKYANFVMSITLDYQQFSKILNDAKNIYGLDFTIDYSIIVKDWAFALPSASDISSYVSNNSTMLNTLVEQAKNNIFIYTPKVLLNPFDARELGVKEIVERSNRNVKDFEKPDSFKYVSSNGQEREVSFEIGSLETVENNENVIKVNVNMIMDKDDLKATSSYSKNFNIIKWEYE